MSRVSLSIRSQSTEIRQDEERGRLAELSCSTLDYMIDYAVALENRLRHHRKELGYFAEEEFDILEGIRLCARLRSVEKNIARTGRTIAAIHAVQGVAQRLSLCQIGDRKLGRASERTFDLYNGPGPCYRLKR
jgi:hypothetical protein